MQEFIKELVLNSDSSYYRSSKIASSYPLLPSTVTNNKKVWVTPRPFHHSGADLGGGCRGCAPTPPPPFEMTCGFLIQLVFCKKTKPLWFIGVEVEQEPSAPPPKKNPGSTPAIYITVTSSTINFAPIQVYKTTRVIGWHRPNAKNGCWIKVLLFELKLTRL